MLQGAIGLSLLYVAYLAWRGWRVMQDARSHRPTASGDRPWITVLVPAADEAAVIATVVADLIAQDYADGGQRRFDALVLDDCSLDATGELARSAASSAPGAITVCRREPNSGPRTKGAVLAWAQAQV